MWYLVTTKYGNEDTAQINLENQHFETYVPLIDVTKTLNGKRQTVTEPAFRGYVFVQFDPQVQSAHKINNTLGVYGLVCFGGEIVPIHNHVIENIKKTFERMAVSTAPVRGDIVRVTSGPFKDFEALFDEPDGKERSKILLNLLNQQQLLIIDNKSITICR